jgi:hypothetical protein
VSCRFPDGDIEVHLGVYEMTEALHRQIQPLRANVFDVMALLREQGLLFSLNHLLHFYRGQAPLDHYLRLLDEVRPTGRLLPPARELPASRRRRRRQSSRRWRSSSV